MAANQKYITFFPELFFKYVVSPICWIVIAFYIKQSFSQKKVIKILIWYSFGGIISVIVLYTLLTLGLTSIVKIFIEKPNIDTNKLGFTLHVYGSLLVFAINFNIINRLCLRPLNIIYILLFVVVLFLSGRTALIVNFFLGIILSIVINLKDLNIKNFKFIISILFIGIIIFVSYQDIADVFKVDLIGYLEGNLDKIKDSGGDLRKIQTDEILETIYKFPLGSGFDNVNIIRDESKPFNYEVFVLTIIMRFGFVVLFIISLSIFFATRKSWKYLFSNQLESFWLWGLISVILSSFTNPYLESISFHWMFFFPLVFLSRTISKKNNVKHFSFK